MTEEKPSWIWRQEVEALTKQLAAVTRERDEMEAYVSRIRLGQELGFVRKQLAAMTQERDEARAIAARMVELSTVTEADIQWATEQLAKRSSAAPAPP
jgi:hypothetical protein